MFRDFFSGLNNLNKMLMSIHQDEKYCRNDPKFTRRNMSYTDFYKQFSLDERITEY